ncbi:hypothetical protein AB3Z07_17535 [Metabacillus halosaccharovorans]|uniref:hypothetical protein n=1 Tax=Bacillaceae TaxID=186817 RepID=UPI00031853BA|nr:MULTISPECIES: hypothetical protein [Bacillaceae]NYV68972.1 hypothetical protein [Bacillus sp. Gen3]MCM3413244.1 hypothetical protein [Metabacillus litoralis]MCR6466035.1 hypothetical protein [Bacillus paranthracis]MCR9022422.1 hypothetical protein [Bacillus paranthracis]MDQ0184434.1 hypothetical protein [Cytobacillus kochii]
MNIIIRALVAGIVAVIAMFLIDIFKVENKIAKLAIYFIFFYSSYFIMDKVDKRKKNL